MLGFDFFAQISLLHDDKKVAEVCRYLIQATTLPIQLPPEEVADLPAAAGVYYFYDNKDCLLYIGKSVNLKNRVLNHFSQDHSQRKDFKLHSQIAHLDFHRTPGDFGACLLENQEIKKHLPVHNIRLRRVRKMFQICLQDSAKGQCKIHIKPVAADQLPDIDNRQFGLFRTVRHASEYLRELADQQQLCHRILGFENVVSGSQNPCFRYQLKRCVGACCGKETLQQHNQRLQQALTETQIQDWPWPSAVMVIEQDSDNPNMTWLHLIDGWVYVAALSSVSDLTDYGFSISNEQVFADMATVAVDNPIQATGFNLDVYHILNRFLNTHRSENLIQKITIVPLIVAGQSL